MTSIFQWFRDLRDYARQVWRAGWLPVSQPQAAAVMLFFLFFLWYAVGKQGGDFLLLDSGNLVIHEGGHALFSYFGDLMTVAGGTILQLLLPFLLAMAFHVRRQPVGYALFLLIVFENLLYVSKYMADARAQAMSYVVIGMGAMEGLPDPSMHELVQPVLALRRASLRHAHRRRGLQAGLAGHDRHRALVRLAMLPKLARGLAVSFGF